MEHIIFFLLLLYILSISLLNVYFKPTALNSRADREYANIYKKKKLHAEHEKQKGIE